MQRSQSKRPTDDIIRPGAGLDADQMRNLAVFYQQERLYLLQSIEDLLWLGEGVSAGSHTTIVEDVLEQLLGGSSGLEEVTAQTLTDSLNRLQGRPHTNQSGMSSPPINAFLGTEEAIALERNVLLTILALIYFHPRKQCTCERFLGLARVFHARLFLMPPQDPAPDGSRSPASLTVHLVRHLYFVEYLIPRIIIK